MKAVVIGGAASGAGKTTLSLGLMSALVRRGLKVQGFKVGPDFIDPGHHALACGRPSHNLDGWMLSRAENLAIFGRWAAECDVAVIEGVMGLYDGFDAQEESGSTAQMAKWLGAPVLLTVGARAMARSLAALALGFYRFDRELSWVGLAANLVGSAGHARLLGRAMETLPELPFLGGLVRDPALALPERHLGLITAEEGGFEPELLNRLADWVEDGLDLDRLLDNLPDLWPPAPPAEPEPEVPGGRKVRIGVARDEAFCFYYQENLRRLAQAGAELVFFSPLADSGLPGGLDGLYLGGGYPELFADRLADNSSLRREIAALGRAGLPIYAECGGMMYLGRELADMEGNRMPMVGLLPIKTSMLARLRSLGYRRVDFRTDTPLGPVGTVARGHEFHYSEIAEVEQGGGLDTRVFNAVGRQGVVPELSAFLTGRILASYVHLHFGSNPELALNFVAACRGGEDQ